MTHRGPFQPRPFCDSVAGEPRNSRVPSVGPRQAQPWGAGREPELTPLSGSAAEGPGSEGDFNMFPKCTLSASVNERFYEQA